MSGTKVRALEMGAELTKGRKNYELTRAGNARLMLQLPSVLVRDIDRVQADLHGRVDVAARAVANHPAVRFHNFVFPHQLAISVRAFLGHDFDELKETLQAGPLDFRGLLRGLALG